MYLFLPHIEPVIQHIQATHNTPPPQVIGLSCYYVTTVRLLIGSSKPFDVFPLIFHPSCSGLGSPSHSSALTPQYRLCPQSSEEQGLGSGRLPLSALCVDSTAQLTAQLTAPRSAAMTHNHHVRSEHCRRDLNADYKSLPHKTKC